MRTTESFEIFPNEASERELARARWLRREGRLAEAEAAYRGVMQQQPSLRSSWTECFELLRSAGKIDEALQLADAAADVFRHEAFPLTLKGAALIEMQRYREALQFLERSVDLDPDLALTWHELGYAAHKLADGNRALLALDRAFALEPHTETLVLRGRILRDAGELYAAEVAFEAARHSAAHTDQLRTIEREIAVTRRAGAFPPKWIREPTAGEAWFAEYGVVVIASEDRDTAPDDAELEEVLLQLIDDRDWAFPRIVTPDDPDRWSRVATALGAPATPLTTLDGAEGALLLSVRPHPDLPLWLEAAARIAEQEAGLSAVLWHDLDLAPAVDVVGALERTGKPLLLGPDTSTAVVMAQHPAARVANRIVARTPAAGAG